ncbi:MAG: 30S ribosomal protein S19e [Candidatus Diapherotrites archaeon]|nr:30S ribosomal protein S19e [Candidatus Diapherotrites archaeon]
MMNPFEVPASELIERMAQDFKARFPKPAFTDWAKSGSHRERAPANPDWWFIRTASILYRIYVDGPLGTERLRTYYGGRKNRGVKPEQFRKSSGKVVRSCLQTLESNGFVKKEKKGRVITPQGHQYLNQKAAEVAPQTTQEGSAPTAPVAQ